MTVADLTSLLGSPSEVGGESRQYPKPSIFKYGDIQFVFSKARNTLGVDKQELLYVYVDESPHGFPAPEFLMKFESA